MSSSRSDSESSLSPSAVQSSTSQKTTVTVFRTSLASASGVSCVPQNPQYAEPSLVCSSPQLGQIRTNRVYVWAWSLCAFLPWRRESLGPHVIATLPGV